MLKHQSDVITAHISACTSEVFRIFAPEQPYEKEETLAAVYENFNETLGWLKYASSSGGSGGEEEDEGDEEDGKKKKKKKKNEKSTRNKASSTTSANAERNAFCSRTPRGY